jgi:hypothetical protein
MTTYATTSKGYNSSYRGANPPSAFAEVLQSDFGQVGGAAPALTAGTSGSLATTTGRVGITWITAEGESTISTEATVSVTGATGSISVAQPTVPTNGATVLGWRVYSSSGAAGSALLNTAALSTTQVQSNIVTQQGTLLAFPVATATVVILIYGTGQAEPGTDLSGIQQALPSVAANTSVDYYFRIPNSSSKWKTQFQPQYSRPQGVLDPVGLTVGPCDIVAPLYQGVSATIALGAYMVMAGYLYLATTGGTTAATFIGGAAFNQAKGSTTTDNTVVWTSYGKAILIRLRFTNGSATAQIPAAQEYDFFAA